jgi:hypothetical protein
MVRGQVATEFFIYAGVFTILLMAAISTVYFTQGSDIARMEFGLAKETGQSFADAINLAVKGGQGFTYSFYFPKKILDKPYYLDFKENSMFITWKGQNENFTYVYNLAQYPYDYRLCQCNQQKDQQMQSDCGEDKFVFSNDGTKVTMIQECPK